MRSAFIGVLLSYLALAPVNAQRHRADRSASEIQRTATFIFHVDPEVNHHDFLYALSNDAVQADASCLGNLPDEQRNGWEQALNFYREEMAERHGRLDPVMREFRVWLVTGEPTPDEPIYRRIHEILDGARDAYRSCFWPKHQAAARAWASAVVPLVRAHETALRERLSEYFQHPWPQERLPVDLVTWTSPSGANTIAQPAHIMLSATNEGYRERAGLEMLFHEASHLLIGSNYGPVAKAIWRENEDRMLPRRNLWHALLFYTVGVTTRDLLSKVGDPGYEPYMYKQGLMESAWPFYREPLETHWQAYLDGQADLASAVSQMIEAIHSNR